MANIGERKPAPSPRRLGRTAAGRRTSPAGKSANAGGALRKAFWWLFGAAMVAGTAVGLSTFTGNPSPAAVPAAPAPAPAVSSVQGIPQVEVIRPPASAANAPPAANPAQSAPAPSAGHSAPAPASGAEQSLGGSQQPLGSPSSGTAPQPPPQQAPASSGQPAIHHNPSPAEIQGPQIQSAPSSGTSPGADANPNPGANPNADAGASPSASSNPQPSTEQAQPPASNGPPPAGQGEGGVPAGSQQNKYVDAVLLAPYTPCGQLFCARRLNARILQSVTGRLPKVSETKPIWVYYPGMGKFILLKGKGDLVKLRERADWAGFFCSYGQCECDRNWGGLKIRPSAWFSENSGIAIDLFWQSLQEHSFSVRAAITPSQYNRAKLSRLQVSLLGAKLPIVSFGEMYKRLTDGSMYPLSKDSLAGLSIREMIDKGYIFFILPMKTVEFNTPNASDSPVGFGLVFPSTVRVSFDYTSPKYATYSGFDFMEVQPVNGKVGASLMVMMLDEPSVINPDGTRKPMDWTVKFYAGGGSVELETTFKVDTVFDMGVRPPSD